MEMKKILKELEDLKFDSYDNIVNEVLDCIAKNQNELFETKTGNDLYKFVECIYLLLLEFDKKDAKHLFLHILGKYNIYFSLIGLESSLYLYKRKLELTKIESLSLRLLYDYENNDFDWIEIEEEEPNIYSSEDFSDDVRFTKSEILLGSRFDIVLECDIRGIDYLYFDKMESYIPLNSIKNKDNIVKDVLSILDLLEKDLI